MKMTTPSVLLLNFTKCTPPTYSAPIVPEQENLMTLRIPLIKIQSNSSCSFFYSDILLCLYLSNNEGIIVLTGSF